MKIAFYGNHTYWGQLNNNGGTRSILLSINALKKLGHEAVFVAHKDRFTWFEHDKPVHKIPRDADAVVAISISEVDAVLKRPRLNLPSGTGGVSNVDSDAVRNGTNRIAVTLTTRMKSMPLSRK